LRGDVEMFTLSGLDGTPGPAWSRCGLATPSNAIPLYLVGSARYTRWMAENTLEIHVGRLLEIRLSKGFDTEAEVDQIFHLLRQQIDKAPPDVRFVLAADWRECFVMSPAASERTLAMMLKTNPRLERSAILFSERSPTAMMQWVRLIRDAKSPNRRLFSDPVEMTTWLAEVLTPEESQRLRHFVEPVAAP
jgi:hypothetical protein